MAQQKTPHEKEIVLLYAGYQSREKNAAIAALHSPERSRFGRIDDGRRILQPVGNRLEFPKPKGKTLRSFVERNSQQAGVRAVSGGKHSLLRAILRAIVQQERLMPGIRNKKSAGAIR